MVIGYQLSVKSPPVWKPVALITAWSFFLCNLFVRFAFLTDDDVSNSKISNRDYLFCEHGKFGGRTVKENSVDVWDAFLNTLENRGRIK